jgi:predicted GH43/DUF377 family glycosyl hydrolase
MSSPTSIFTRHPLNPIVRPGTLPWRRAVVFNPAVIREEDGTFYMIERAAGSLRPFQCAFGLLHSRDGIAWKHASAGPILTPSDLGYPYGSLQDPRRVKMDSLYYLVGVLRPYCWDCLPTGIGLPEYREVNYPNRNFDEPNVSRSFIATSADLRSWRVLGYCSDIACDDRDNILFPEKINGRYALLRRPLDRMENGSKGPGIWLSYSDDAVHWGQPQLIAGPEQAWEGQKIGGATPPVRTPAGWLALYHGVDADAIYRVGALLLDAGDPAVVLARTGEPIFEPQEYYECTGLVIPNVVFPSGNVIVGDELWIYYGVCDSAIALATIKLEDLLRSMSGQSVRSRQPAVMQTSS